MSNDGAQKRWDAQIQAFDTGRTVSGIRKGDVVEARGKFEVHYRKF